MTSTQASRLGPLKSKTTVSCEILDGTARFVDRQLEVNSIGAGTWRRWQWQTRWFVENATFTWSKGVCITLSFNTTKTPFREKHLQSPTNGVYSTTRCPWALSLFCFGIFQQNTSGIFVHDRVFNFYTSYVMIFLLHEINEVFMQKVDSLGHWVTTEHAWNITPNSYANISLKIIAWWWWCTFLPRQLYGVTLITRTTHFRYIEV